ncbi:MAG: 2OG-Fe(II) oxygenase, partial [Bdellovibrionales bacterium]
PSFLSEDNCAMLTELYHDDGLFRHTVDMEHMRYGKGEYRYFDGATQPSIVSHYRQALYSGLVHSANTLATSLELEYRYPETWEEFKELCDSHGQTENACLLLHYEKGGYNKPHIDTYGKVFFPYQAVTLLSDDFSGGDFTITTKQNNKRTSIELYQPGDTVIFSSKYLPMHKPGTTQKVMSKVLHGVERITDGSRDTLGVIAHNLSPYKPK